MKTIVYVDGFNLNYGAIKDTPYKWLNIHRMCELLLPKNQIIGMKYFTAKVFSRKKRSPKTYSPASIFAGIENHP